MNRAVLVVCVGMLVGCGASHNEGVPEANQQAVLFGDSTETPGTKAAVFLGACSGVLVNRHTVATVEHCIEQGDVTRPPLAKVEVLIEGGSEGHICHTPSASGSCAKWSLRVSRQPSSDVVLLQSERSFANVTDIVFPLIDEQAVSASLPRATGYGVSALRSVATGELRGIGKRLSAPMQITQWDREHAYGRPAAAARLCGGDSGGPLLASLDDSASLLLGVLSASEYDPADEFCTKVGGLHRWSKLDPRFIESVAGPCTREKGGWNCREGGFVRTRVALPEEESNSSQTEIAAALRAKGAKVFKPHDVTAATIRQQGLVGLATSEGDFLVDFGGVPRTDRNVINGEGDNASGAEGVRVPLAPRNIALSGNGDQRQSLFISQVGALRTDSGTSAPGCTATLIGRRIVRTAKHCIESVARPYFTLRYNGGPTTWTFDNGATYVTFNPRRADGHYYGGNYFNFECDFAHGAPLSPECDSQDWALLIMGQNVWDPVNVIPSYMGFSGHAVGTVSHVGYPSCSDINSNISNCVTGKMYGHANCSIRVALTASYYSNCDVSGGDSGGPAFRTTNGVRYLVGNHVGGPTNSGCSDGTCETVDCGTDSWLYDFQSQLRADYNTVTL